MQSDNKMISQLEGLRGILALSVCFGHYGIEQITYRFGVSFNFHFAVDIFFMISGFVMAYSNYYAKQKPSFVRFTIKRFARLYPLHLLTLLCMLILVQGHAPPLRLDIFGQHILLIHNLAPYTVNDAFNFPSWSISVEFYCALLFFMLTNGIPRQWFKRLLPIVLFVTLLFC